MVLALLLAINLLNYIDRAVLAAVESKVRAELFPIDPDHARGQMGWLPTAFLLTYMVAAPLFGWMADRVSRWWIISAGVIVWSLASGASGLATSFGMLLTTRLFLGVGEAAYGPAAPTILADLYPVSKRGRVLALFYLAIPVGSALGYLLGGYMAEHWSWRYAFYLSMPPGVLLGLICLWQRDPRQPQAIAQGSTAPAHFSAAHYWELAHNPSFVLNTLAMAAMTFSLGAVSFWMPTYVNETRGQPSLARVTFYFGAITVVAGILATLLGGWLGDKLRRRWSGSYFLVSGVGMLIATPLFLLVLVTPFPAAWGLIFLTEFCIFLSTGPSNAILANVTRPAIRATAFAINILLIHLLGDAVSPQLVGMISDHYDMNVAFASVSGAIALSGILWIAGAKFLEHDTAAASAAP